MKQDLRDAIMLTATAAAILFIVGLMLKNGWAAVMFMISFLLVFFIPFVPFALTRREATFIEKFILIMFLGLSVMPILFFMFGIFGLPLTTLTYILFPAIIFGATMWYYIKSQK